MVTEMGSRDGTVIIIIFTLIISDNKIKLIMEILGEIEEMF